jgi:hypothetical protein
MVYVISWRRSSRVHQLVSLYHGGSKAFKVPVFWDVMLPSLVELSPAKKMKDEEEII